MTSQVPAKKTLASAVFWTTSPALSKIGRVSRKRMARTVATLIITRSTAPISHGSNRMPSGRTSDRPFLERDGADPVDEASLSEVLGPGQQSGSVPVVAVGNGEGRGDEVRLG